MKCQVCTPGIRLLCLFVVFLMVFGIVSSILFVNVVLSRLGLDVGLGLICLFVVLD